MPDERDDRSPFSRNVDVRSTYANMPGKKMNGIHVRFQTNETARGRVRGLTVLRMMSVIDRRTLNGRWIVYAAVSDEPIERIRRWIRPSAVRRAEVAEASFRTVIDAETDVVDEDVSLIDFTDSCHESQLKNSKRNQACK